jgi:hypothetical protein
MNREELPLRHLQGMLSDICYSMIFQVPHLKNYKKLKKEYNRSLRISKTEGEVTTL